MPATDAGTAAWVADDYLSIPQQARPPAADMLPPVVSADGASELAGNVFGPSAADSAHGEWAATVAPGDAFTADVGPTGIDGEPDPGDQVEFAGADPIGAPPEMQELAPLPPLPDPSPAGPVGSASLAPPRARKNTKAAYRGPRYQGSAPRYKAAPGPAEQAQADTEDTTAGSAVPAARAAAADRFAAADPVAADSALPREAAVAPETALVPEVPVAAETIVAPPSVAAPPTVVEPESAGAPPTVVEPESAGAPPTVVEPESAGAPPSVAAPQIALALEAAIDQDPAGAPATAKAADVSVAKPAVGGATKPARARSRQGSKANRARRPGPSAHEAWDSLSEESADSSM